MINTKIIVVVIISFITSLIVNIKLLKSQPVIQTQKENNNTDEVCISKIDLGDLNKDKKSEYLIQCKGKVEIIVSPYTDDGNGKNIEDVSTFPDLFHFPGYDDSSILRSVMVFPKTNPSFILVKSELNTGGSYLEAFAVYKLKDGKIEQILKKGFNDLKGRNVNVVPSDNKNEIKVTIEKIKDYSTGELEKIEQIYKLD